MDAGIAGDKNAPVRAILENGLVCKSTMQDEFSPATVAVFRQLRRTSVIRITFGEAGCAFVRCNRPVPGFSRRSFLCNADRRARISVRIMSKSRRSNGADIKNPPREIRPFLCIAGNARDDRKGGRQSYAAVREQPVQQRGWFGQLLYS
jgi:hypothetical protein